MVSPSNASRQRNKRLIPHQHEKQRLSPASPHALQSGGQPRSRRGMCRAFGFFVIGFVLLCLPSPLQVFWHPLPTTENMNGNNISPFGHVHLQHQQDKMMAMRERATKQLQDLERLSEQPKHINGDAAPESALNRGIQVEIANIKAEAANDEAVGDELHSVDLITYDNMYCHGEGHLYHFTSKDPSETKRVHPEKVPKSVLLKGPGVAVVYLGEQGEEYAGAVMAVEGCIDMYDLFPNRNHMHFVLHTATDTSVVLTARQQISTKLQQQFATTSDLSQPHTRIVFSAVSSEYMGYQVYANALGFLQSNQTNASWLRLLSGQMADDLSEIFPTFTSPTSLYSRFYSPINKADVIDKWFHSKDAPHPDDTIVVIDPDNWLLKDVHKWLVDVAPKKAVGQEAYYWEATNATVQLWHEVCLHNCDVQTIDSAAVPYLVKASDLKDIAPLWRNYSIEIKERFQTNTTFKALYGPTLGVRWAAEMFGYNFACAHLGIQTKIVRDLQARDVDLTPNWEHWTHIPMIHTGRAWFPPQHKELAEPWRHSDQSMSGEKRGVQVWCKCNETAAKVQPWPLPDGLEYVSYHTLRLLHESTERFGPIPVNETFRKSYGWTMP